METSTSASPPSGIAETSDTSDSSSRSGGDTPSRLAASGGKAALISDAVAWTVFCAMALGRHEPSQLDLLASALASVALLVVGYFGAAFALGVYRRPHAWGPVVLAWLFGIAFGDMARSLLLWKDLIPVYALTTLLIAGILLLGWRGVWAIVRAVRA